MKPSLNTCESLLRAFKLSEKFLTLQDIKLFEPCKIYLTSNGNNTLKDLASSMEKLL